jgi:hypothetical protein
VEGVYQAAKGVGAEHGEVGEHAGHAEPGGPTYRAESSLLR